MKLSDWQTEEKLSHVNSLFHLQLAGVLLPTIIHPKSSKTHLQEHFSTFLTSTSTRPSVNQNLQFIYILNSMFLDVVSACGLEGDRRWDAISSLAPPWPLLDIIEETDAIHCSHSLMSWCKIILFLLISYLFFGFCLCFEWRVRHMHLTIYDNIKMIKVI